MVPPAAWGLPRRSPGSRLSRDRAGGCLPDSMSKGGFCWTRRWAVTAHFISASLGGK